MTSLTLGTILFWNLLKKKIKSYGESFFVMREGIMLEISLIDN